MLTFIGQLLYQYSHPCVLTIFHDSGRRTLRQRGMCFVNPITAAKRAWSNIRLQRAYDACRRKEMGKVV